jgi:hypothetical protein
VDLVEPVLYSIVEVVVSVQGLEGYASGPVPVSFMGRLIAEKGGQWFTEEDAI